MITHTTIIAERRGFSPVHPGGERVEARYKIELTYEDGRLRSERVTDDNGRLVAHPDARVLIDGALAELRA